MGAVVLFDGVCNFCDSSVNFIIDHDREGYFKFAPLQSDEGRRLANEFGFSSAVGEAEPASDLIPIDSVILVEDGKAYTHSTAALKIIRRLGSPGRCFTHSLPYRQVFGIIFISFLQDIAIESSAKRTSACCRPPKCEQGS